MPGVVRTPEQEKLWQTAKEKAEKQGQKDNYAYIMSIYKGMGGLNKTAMEDLFNEKTAKVGFLGKVMGKNIKPAKQEFEAALNVLKNKRDLLKSERVLRRGYFDPIARAPLKHDKKQLSKMLSTSPEADKVKQAKKRLDYESKESTKAALKGLAGLGVGGLLVGQQLKNRKGRYYYPEKEVIASELLKEASFKAKATKFLEGVGDLASFKNFRIVRQDLKNLKAGVNPEDLRSIHRLQKLRRDTEKLIGKKEKIKKITDRFSGLDEKSIGKVIDDELYKKRKFGPERRIRNLENKTKRYDDIIGTAKAKYEKGYRGFEDDKDKEFLKSMGLWSSALIPTAYAGKKYLDKKKQDSSS